MTDTPSAPLSEEQLDRLEDWAVSQGYVFADVIIVRLISMARDALALREAAERLLHHWDTENIIEGYDGQIDEKFSNQMETLRAAVAASRATAGTT